MRNIYAYSIMISSVGFDVVGQFDHFMIAYGGKDLFTPDGKVHTDEPQTKEAAVKAVTRLATAYKQGFLPPSVVNWNDNDDNNAFHAKLVVMDFDGTISTEVALWKNKEAYDDILTLGLPLSNDGKPVAGVMGPQALVVPKGAPNITVAKDFLKYSIEPRVLAALLKGGLGRRLPPMKSIVEKIRRTSRFKPTPSRASTVRRSRPMRCTIRRARRSARSMCSPSRSTML
jgi:multiple sugar transport system substrate-binding protein